MASHLNGHHASGLIAPGAPQPSQPWQTAWQAPRLPADIAEWSSEVGEGTKRQQLVVVSLGPSRDTWPSFPCLLLLALACSCLPLLPGGPVGGHPPPGPRSGGGHLPQGQVPRLPHRGRGPASREVSKRDQSVKTCDCGMLRSALVMACSPRVRVPCGRLHLSEIRAECSGLEGGGAALQLLEPAFLDKPRFCGHGANPPPAHQPRAPQPANGRAGSLGGDFVPRLDLSALRPVAGMPSGGRRRSNAPLSSQSTISLAWA